MHLDESQDSYSIVQHISQDQQLLNEIEEDILDALGVDDDSPTFNGLEIIIETEDGKLVAGRLTAIRTTSKIGVQGHDTYVGYDDDEDVDEASPWDEESYQASLYDPRLDSYVEDYEEEDDDLDVYDLDLDVDEEERRALAFAEKHSAILQDEDEVS